MARKGVWGFLRGLGRRKASDPLAGFVTLEFSPPAPDPDPVTGERERGGHPAERPPGKELQCAQSGDDPLREVFRHCVESLIKPALIKLNADDSLIRHPTSKAVLAALLAYWLLAVSSSLILLVAALAAPAVRSAQALESGDPGRRRRWLRYWTVYAAVGAVSTVSDPLHAFVPGYWTAKTLLLLWCAAPYPWNGTDYVYSSLVVPGWRHLTDTLRACLCTADSTDGADATDETPG